MNLAVVQVRTVHKASLLLASIFTYNTALAQINAADIDSAFKYRFYAGGSAGYGSTTWQGLVPAESKQNFAINMSTPIDASEGGGVFGAFAGFEFSPYFALETAYMHFPTATISFDESSLFAFDHDDETNFVSRTEMVSIIAKVMLIIPKTTVRLYSDFGIANVHRDDDIKKEWLPTPTFGLGANYNLDPHLMTEVALNYTAGYGESEISPVDDYIPFLYSISFKLAYRI